MKRFVYYVNTVGRSKYGGVYEIATVYQVKRNYLEFIGRTRKWCTASYMGRSGEVNAFLLENKNILKTWSKDYDGSLTEYYKNNEKYEIREI